MFDALDISSSALAAQRANLDVIAGNIAMRDVTRDEQGRIAPYRRRVALFEASVGGHGEKKPGVRVSKIVEDLSPGELRWDPGHPDAGKEGPDKGYVRLSNVDYHTEMVNAMSAVRAYEASATVAEMAKHLATTALSLLA